MLKVKYEVWNQNREIFRKEALAAKHPRTRERLMALYEISAGKSPTRVGKETKRNPQTVMEWVHKYNQGGLAALKYQRRGRTPACSVFTLRRPQRRRCAFLAKQSKKILEIKSKKL